MDLILTLLETYQQTSPPPPIHYYIFTFMIDLTQWLHIHIFNYYSLLNSTPLVSCDLLFRKGPSYTAACDRDEHEKSAVNVFDKK